MRDGRHQALHMCGPHDGIVCCQTAFDVANRGTSRGDAWHCEDLAAHGMHVDVPRVAFGRGGVAIVEAGPFGRAGF